ncbi:EAL domain-containing protein [Sulfurimonas sp. ST-27]|uniref:EAL domain-containing protein n=1 Tax=Sulfurimonas sp. ST-27 TaxID=3400152 RepID=UPI003AB46617
MHANIKQELLHGANSVPLILKSTYHDDNLLAKKPSYAQDFENIKNLTQFIRNTHLAYVYSFVRDKNNIIRFSSSSAKEKDLEQNSSDIYSFDTYTDPQLQELFNTANFNQPLFNHSKDKWGDFYSVYILKQTKNGKKYVVGADYNIQDIITLKHILLSKILYLIVPVFFIILFYMFFNFIVVKRLNSIVTQKTDEIEKAYNVDALTQLENAKKLVYDLAKKHNDIPFFIAILDIEHFGMLNDIYGYAYGNEYLKYVAKLLQKNISLDLKLYKLHADLFCIVNTQTMPVKAFMQKTEDILSALNHQKFTYEGYKTTLSMKAGIGEVVESSNPFIHAEIALKFAKKHNMLLALYHENMNHNKKNKRILDDIDYALQYNKVYSYLQPIYDVKQHKIIKYETLMRLERQNGEIVAPWYFLDVAKKTPLYHKLSLQMFTQVIQIAKKNPSLSFSFNISALDIQNSEFCEAIFTQAVQENIARQLTLEILESEEFDNFDALCKFIQKAKDARITIAMDDFGSGYSNLSNVIKLNLNYLKIDGSIVKYIASDIHYEKLFKNIINLAKELDLITIAEYIEDETIQNKAIELGIDMLQGYHIGKPLPDILD